MIREKGKEKGDLTRAHPKRTRTLKGADYRKKIKKETTQRKKNNLTSSQAKIFVRGRGEGEDAKRGEGGKRYLSSLKKRYLFSG